MTNRRCGDCTLCCRLVPVENLAKTAGERCRFQTRHGCKVYADLSIVSAACHVWSCQWLVDPEAAGLRRPDHCHYVVDIMPDYVGGEQDTGEVVNISCMQVWCDPDYPDAWRDPALRRYAEHVAKTRHMAMLVRFGLGRAIVVFAPCLSHDNEWHEMPSMIGTGRWVNPLDRIRGSGRGRYAEQANRVMGLLGEA